METITTAIIDTNSFGVNLTFLNLFSSQLPRFLSIILWADRQSEASHVLRLAKIP